MAEPITNIHRKQLTEQEEVQLKWDNLKQRFSHNEASLNKVLDIIEELNEAGMLEAVEAMLLAKEDITKITLDQVSREPVTNLLNIIIGATSSLMATDPEKAKNVIDSAMKGLDSGHEFVETEQKVKLFDLMRMLNDPDINRAIGFGIHFLKGMGQQLSERSDEHVKEDS